MVDQFKKIIQEKQGLAAGKREGLDSAPGAIINESFDPILVQAAALKNLGTAHTALGTVGIAVAGVLNNQLAGETALEKRGKLVQAHEILSHEKNTVCILNQKAGRKTDQSSVDHLSLASISDTTGRDEYFITIVFEKYLPGSVR
jgi:hypothetical protein